MDDHYSDQWSAGNPLLCAGDRYATQNAKQQQQQAKPATKQASPEPFDQLAKKFNEHTEWLLRCNELIDKDVSPIDELESGRLIFELKVSLLPLDPADSRKLKWHLKFLPYFKEFEQDLPYRLSIFNNDYNRFINKLKSSSEIDSANRISNDLQQKFEKVSDHSLDQLTSPSHAILIHFYL